jgi:hypothetical protein
MKLIKVFFAIFLEIFLPIEYKITLITYVIIAVQCTAFLSGKVFKSSIKSLVISTLGKIYI